MEMRVSRQTITGWQTVLETGGEQTIEAEFVLPDYHADVQRILRCQPSVSIIGRQVGDDKVTVTGSLLMRILYVSAEGEMHCATKSIEFKKVFETKKLPEGIMIDVHPSMRQSRCRAINPRKLELYGVAYIQMKGYCERGNTVISDITDGGVESKTESLMVNRMLGYAEKQITLSDELELAQGKPSVQRILDSGILSMVDDCRIIPGKAIIKGELVIHLLYIGDVTSDQPEQMDFSMPISQVIDFEGLTDGSYCDVRIDVVSFTIHPRTDPDGTCRRFAFDAVIAAKASATAQKKIEYVSDAYSKQYQSQQTYSDLSIERIADQVSDQRVVRNTIDTSARPVARIINTWSDVSVNGVTVSGNQAVINGVISAALLVQDEVGENFVLERDFNYEQNYPLKESLQRPTANGELSVVSNGYSFTDGNIELRTELKTVLSVSDFLPVRILSGIEVDETSPKPQNPAALVLCYAGKGERLWDIAKHYNTSMQAIMEENSLETAELDTSTMLMIPKA